MTTVYCTAPFVGLTVREDGKVKTCCVGGLTIGNLNNDSICQVAQSQVLQTIQQDMLSNTPNLENCKSCTEKEKHSELASLRQYYMRHYPTFDPQDLQLKVLDIRWNNTCNLGCVYCNSTFSSVWENRMSVARSTISKPYQDDLLNWILDKIDHVQEIMLVGGEPMLMKQNYVLFNQLPQTARISVITNLSYDFENLPCIEDLLRRPAENVIWNVSLENIGSKFEYARSGAKWTQIEKNFDFLLKHWPESISINMVYSVLSAFDLPDTILHLQNIGIKKFNLMNIDGKDNLPVDVYNLPIEIQQIAAAKLLQARNAHQQSLHPEDRDLYPMQGADDIYHALQTNQVSRAITWSEFEEKIKWYDRWGQHKYQDLWPDIYNLVRKSLNAGV